MTTCNHIASPVNDPGRRRHPIFPTQHGVEQAREAGLFRHQWSDAREQPAQQTDALTREEGPCLQKVVSLFSPCYLLLEKLSKSLILHGNCPFLRNTLPVLLENVPVSKSIPDRWRRRAWSRKSVRGCHRQALWGFAASTPNQSPTAHQPRQSTYQKFCKSVAYPAARSSAINSA
jgi:hypothetical protein